MPKKWLLSVFDLTGNASRPYREDSNWEVTQIDIQLGIDLYNYDFEKEWRERNCPEVGLILMAPCTDYACSGAKHFKAKDADGRTEESQRLMRRVKSLFDFFKSTGKLLFWQLENPRTRIHKLNPWLGKPLQKFNPTDFAGYDPIPRDSRYNKETWLFGEFNKMTPKRLEPFSKDNPGWRKLGGKSLKTKNLRSITPLGFAYAFYEANK